MSYEPTLSSLLTLHSSLFTIHYSLSFAVHPNPWPLESLNPAPNSLLRALCALRFSLESLF